jgi:uncharacterized phiE125 gp8 family phage protein
MQTTGRYQAELVTGPTVEPLTLSESKKQLEIAANDSSHDTALQSAIAEARQQWEHDTDSVCCFQTWKLQIQSLTDRMPLPKRPIHSITSIQYYDGNNTLQTLSSSLYQLHINEFRLAYQATLPATSDRWDAWQVTYKAGYSQDGQSVPAIAKRAMLLLIGYYFENRDMLVNEATYNRGVYESLVMRFARSNYP